MSTATPSTPTEPTRLVRKSTKIVSTLGPTSSTPDILRQLVCAGVNVFRLNFSHGTHVDKAKIIQCIRDLSVELHHDVAIMADLQGPKIRIGELEEHKPFHIERDQVIGLISGELQPLGNPKRLSTGTKHAHVLVEHLQVGHRVLINDGAIVLRVERRVGPKELECRVVVGGEISEKKGVNVPDLQVPTAAVTDKDREDALFALSYNVEYMALSFVQRPQDVQDLRDIIKSALKDGQVAPKIIAKIEKPQAIEVIDDIIAVVDGIMVARGDLGVECSFEKVPAYQKMLIRKCNAANKPVITATQMLESMIHAPTPTRAEASDVFNAVYDHTDAVMLSGETASGEYPVEAVQAMASIVVEAEQHQYNAITSSDPLDYAIAQSAVAAANTGINAQALIMIAVNFDMGVYLAKLRPRCPIIAVTFSKKLAAQLEMCYGCHSLVLPEPSAGSTTDQLLVAIEAAIQSHGWLRDGDQFVFCCGDAPLAGLRNTLQLGHFGDFGRASKEVGQWSSLTAKRLAE